MPGSALRQAEGKLENEGVPDLFSGAGSGRKAAEEGKASGEKTGPARAAEARDRAAKKKKRKSRRRPTLPPRGSTIGAGALDFRVRNGNGYIRPAMAAGIIIIIKRKKREGMRSAMRREKGYGQGSRPISTARLCASPRLHLRPINPVFRGGP